MKFYNKSNFVFKSLFISMWVFSLLYVNAVDLNAADGQTTILFLGDSLTAGYGVEKDEAYPSRLEDLLREKGINDVKLINAGISGSTTASGLSRLKWYQRAKPDLLFLALGANDGLRGLSLEAMEKNLNDIIEAAKAEGMTVILAGMEIPPNYGEEYTRQFREVFQTLSHKHAISLMPFLLREVGGIPHLNQSDGIHPNLQGHRIIADNVLPYIITAINKR